MTSEGIHSITANTWTPETMHKRDAFFSLQVYERVRISQVTYMKEQEIRHLDIT